MDIKGGEVAMEYDEKQLKEVLEEFSQQVKQGVKISQEVVDQEKDLLVDTVHFEIKNLYKSINTDIERKIAFLLEYGIEEYEITFAYDPPYDHSGTLIRTNNWIDKDSTQNFQDFLKKYTGQEVPTFESGMGFRYCTYEEEILEKIRSMLYESCLKTIYMMIIEKKINQLVLKTIKEYKNIDANFYSLEEYIVDEILDLIECEDILCEYDVMENLPVYKENMKLCDIYTIHEFIARKFRRNKERYEKEIAKLLQQLYRQAEGIPIDKKFKRKIEKKDRDLIQELEKSYSSYDLGLLIYFEKLNLSNTVYEKFRLKFGSIIECAVNEKREELIQKYPH